MTSGLLAQDRVAAHHPSLRATPELVPTGCGGEHPALAGRPGGIAVAPDGRVFVSLPDSGAIWRLEPGEVAAASVGTIDRVASSAGIPILAPAGLAVGPDGTLFVADITGHRVWAIGPAGDGRVVAGGAYGFRDGPGDEALFRHPSDVAIGPDGTCYVADSGNHRVRTISPDGVVATLAGSIYAYGDGRGPDGRFREPLALDVDAGGTCYVADTGNNAIRRVTPWGDVTTVAGAPPGGDADGTGPAVGLRWPTGIAVGHDGRLWVADGGSGALRRIERDGRSTTTLRLNGRRWPVAVALAPGGEPLVAAESLDEAGRRRTCLVAAGAG